MLVDLAMEITPSETINFAEKLAAKRKKEFERRLAEILRSHENQESNVVRE